jgi:hypothetical protein
LITRLSDWHKSDGRSERHLFVAGLSASEAAAAKAGAGFGIPLAAQQLEPVDPDHGLAALFAAGAVGPAVELEGADDAQQGALADVVGGYLGLLARG